MGYNTADHFRQVHYPGPSTSSSGRSNVESRDSIRGGQVTALAEPMTTTGGFAIAAGHHRAPTESSGNSRARPLRSPPGVGHSFLLGSDFHPVPEAGFAIPPASGPGRCRLFSVSGNAPNPLTSRRKNIMANSKPVSEIRIGSIKATVWPNDAEGRTRLHRHLLAPLQGR